MNKKSIITLAILTAMTGSAYAATFVFKSPADGVAVPSQVGTFVRANPTSKYHADSMYLDQSSSNLGDINIGESLTKFASFVNNTSYSLNNLTATIQSQSNPSDSIEAMVSCSPPLTTSSADANEVCDLSVNVASGSATTSSESVVIKVKGVKSSVEYVEGEFTLTYNVVDPSNNPDPEPPVVTPPSQSGQWCDNPDLKIANNAWQPQGQTIRFPARPRGNVGSIPDNLFSVGLTHSYPNSLPKYVTISGFAVTEGTNAPFSVTSASQVSNSIVKTSSYNATTTTFPLDCINTQLGPEKSCTSNWYPNYDKEPGVYSGSVTVSTLEKGSCTVPFTYEVLPAVSASAYPASWTYTTRSNFKAADNNQLITPSITLPNVPTAKSMTISFSGDTSNLINTSNGTSIPSVAVVNQPSNGTTTTTPCVKGAGLDYVCTWTGPNNKIGMSSSAIIVNSPSLYRVDVTATSNSSDVSSPGAISYYMYNLDYIGTPRWYPHPTLGSTNATMVTDKNGATFVTFSMKDSKKAKFTLTGDTSKFKVFAGGGIVTSPVNQAFYDYNSIPNYTYQTNYYGGCSSHSLVGATEFTCDTSPYSSIPSVIVAFTPYDEVGTFLAGLQVQLLDQYSMTHDTPDPIMLIGDSRFDANAQWSIYTSSTTAPTPSFGTVKANSTSSSTKVFYLRNAGAYGKMNVGFNVTGDTSDFRIIVSKVISSSNISTDNCGPSQGDPYLGASACTTDAKNGGLRPHILVTAAFMPKSTGNKQITLTPYSGNGTIVAAPITFTGTGN